MTNYRPRDFHDAAPAAYLKGSARAFVRRLHLGGARTRIQNLAVLAESGIARTN